MRTPNRCAIFPGRFAATRQTGLYDADLTVNRYGASPGDEAGITAAPSLRAEKFDGQASHEDAGADAVAGSARRVREQFQ